MKTTFSLSLVSVLLFYSTFGIAGKIILRDMSSPSKNKNSEMNYYLPILQKNYIDYSTVSGSVVIADGQNKIGACAGQDLTLTTHFSASSLAGDVTHMRTVVAYTSPPVPLTEQPWDDFVTENTITITVQINWGDVVVYVQYRDVFGYLSPIFSDYISIEGFPSGWYGCGES